MIIFEQSKSEDVLEVAHMIKIPIVYAWTSHITNKPAHH